MPTTKTFPNTAAAARYIARFVDHTAVRMETTTNAVIAHEQCDAVDATHTGFSATMGMVIASRPARTYRVVRTNAKSVVVSLVAA